MTLIRRDLNDGAASGDFCTGRQFSLKAHPTPDFAHLEGKHPCFGRDGAPKTGRLHLPVSPACNIACAFCRRDFNATDHRPGVARGLVRPEDAVETVERALRLCPEITVVGIAGPGDTLATDHAIEAFERVHAARPDLINCLSTNGLLLEEKAERVVAAGVKTITVTVNAVDPAVLSQLCQWIVWKGRKLTGTEAAEQLITNQLAGIRKVAGLGATVKVNAVLVPGINDAHIGAIAQAVAAAGASIINVIPLIPQHDLAHVPPPDVGQVAAARAEAARHLAVFSHCARCRADACGVPGGRDQAGELHGDAPAQEATFSHG
jgi:nitrogen fixation protein NifB